jgi:hypothetical protein
MPLSQARLDRALEEMSPFYRERLQAFIGKKYEEWGNLQIPSVYGKPIKQTPKRMEAALNYALGRLRHAIRLIPEDEINLEVESNVCPHCGGKLTIRATIEKG